MQSQLGSQLLLHTELKFEFLTYTRPQSNGSESQAGLRYRGSWPRTASCRCGIIDFTGLHYLAGGTLSTRSDELGAALLWFSRVRFLFERAVLHSSFQSAHPSNCFPDTYGQLLLSPVDSFPASAHLRILCAATTRTRPGRTVAAIA